MDLLEMAEQDQMNETPMYVRRHLDDPVFLQPDQAHEEMLPGHDYHHSTFLS
jgi:hypothetical protein